MIFKRAVAKLRAQDWVAISIELVIATVGVIIALAAKIKLGSKFVRGAQLRCYASSTPRHSAAVLSLACDSGAMLPKSDLGYRLSGLSVELFEIRPMFQAPIQQAPPRGIDISPASVPGGAGVTLSGQF